MKLKSLYHFLILTAVFLASCCQCKSAIMANNAMFIFKGRIEKITNYKAILIGSASSITFTFKGTQANYQLQAVDSWEHHNYFCLQVDGQYKGRFRIEKGIAQIFSINDLKESKHVITIYKATEAASGNILFDGAPIKNLLPTILTSKKKIEFIGDSITCGAASDSSDVPCDQGEYFDHHNAYLAYGPELSRSLNTDFLLSSVSGIGMYRNWNDEHVNEPIMPEVYENLYLNREKKTPFEASYQPDLVSICLGTNDLSDGDGVKQRLPFNKDKYIANYINFIKMLYKRYPKTRIVLLNSPMVSGERNTVLVECLKTVIKAFDTNKSHKPIALFEYQPMQPHGCGYHPNLEDHKAMATQLQPFFSQLLNEK